MQHGRFVLLLELSYKGKSTRLRGYGPRSLMIRDTSVEHKFSLKVNRRRFDEALKEIGAEPRSSAKKE